MKALVKNTLVMDLLHAAGLLHGAASLLSHYPGSEEDVEELRKMSVKTIEYYEKVGAMKADDE